MAAARAPAAAPASAGEAGAARRNASSSAARGANAKRGMAVRHTSALLPTSLAFQVPAGSSANSATSATTASSTTGITRQRHAAEASGRAKARQAPEAATRAASTSTSFRSKRQVAKAARQIDTRAEFDGEDHERHQRTERDGASPIERPSGADDCARSATREATSCSVFMSCPCDRCRPARAGRDGASRALRLR